jgi:acetyltransferase-like isoleucine patch superfamily enzyme
MVRLPVQIGTDVQAWRPRLCSAAIRAGCGARAVAGENGMRVAFDPASPDRLRRFGLGLKFDRPTRFTAEFAVEAPVEVAAEIDTARPCRIGAFTSVAGGMLRHVAIGRYCTVAGGVQTGWADAPERWATTSAPARLADPHGWASLLGHDGHAPPDDFPPARQGTTIGHDVWIGEGAFLRPGVTVGDGAVVAPRTMVMADVAPFAVVEGAPAQVVRMRFDEATVARLLALAWWRFSLFQLPPALPRDVAAFLDHVEQAAARGAIEPYEPGWHAPEDLAALVE